jgi:hypothetical protein
MKKCLMMCDISGRAAWLLRVGSPHQASYSEEKQVKSINFLGRRIPVPANRLLRILLGVAAVLGGIFGFLPILGFWMLPLGLLILSIDFPPVRRFRRVATVRMVGWLKRKWPRLAQRIGLKT